MTREEKAKAYDEALERAKEILECSVKSDSAEVRMVLPFFPELKESGDERIRKELILYHRSMAAAMNGNRPCVHEAWIAWLEKQGEQKSVEWGEEDDEMLEEALNQVKYAFCEQEGFFWEDKPVLVWLKSLKDRCVQQPKQEQNKKGE